MDALLTGIGTQFLLTFLSTVTSQITTQTLVTVEFSDFADRLTDVELEHVNTLVVEAAGVFVDMVTARAINTTLMTVMATMITVMVATETTKRK